jgi:uncharacterized protein (TIGR03435 family)
MRSLPPTMINSLLTVLVALPFLHAMQAGKQATLPEFEVASVRPSGPNQRELNGLYTYPGGKVMCKGCRLQYLIMVAFDVQQFQISGGPSWIDLVGGARYDIEAIPPATSQSIHSNPAIPKNPPNDEQRQMLQSLLIGRFHLKFHAETQEGPVYILTRKNKPLNLQASKDKNAYSWAGGIEGGPPDISGLRGTNISMPQLALRISSWLKRPVLDQTGLQESYDFEYRMGIDNDDPNADLVSSILTSLQGIGLNLKSTTGPVETIRVDHVEQPSPN